MFGNIKQQCVIPSTQGSTCHPASSAVKLGTTVSAVSARRGCGGKRGKDGATTMTGRAIVGSVGTCTGPPALTAGCKATAVALALGTRGGPMAFTALATVCAGTGTGTAGWLGGTAA